MLYKVHSSVGDVRPGAEIRYSQRIGPDRQFQRVLHIRGIREEEALPNGTTVYYVEGWYSLEPFVDDAKEETPQ